MEGCVKISLLSTGASERGEDQGWRRVTADQPLTRAKASVYVVPLSVCYVFVRACTCACAELCLQFVSFLRSICVMCEVGRRTRVILKYRVAFCRGLAPNVACGRDGAFLALDLRSTCANSYEQNSGWRLEKKSRYRVCQKRKSADAKMRNDAVIPLRS